MAPDVLSNVLKTVRLTGATFFDFETRAPWAAEQPPRDRLLPMLLPGAAHLISYHVISEGGCYAGIVGADPVMVRAGEVIVFTKGDPHVLSSSPGMRADAAAPDRLTAMAGARLPFPVRSGGDGPVTARFVCGFLACDDRPFNPLLDNLPSVIKVAGAGDWLGELMRLAVTESVVKRAGGESVLAKLSELMFIEVVRRHLDGLPPEQAGWLAGLRDAVVGKALALLHANPTRDWTIGSLAKESAVSRSALAQRFADLVGMPPMHYLARWRMQMAVGLLNGGAGLAAVADAVGYGSEAAFSRAFKKLVGMPPSNWRRGERQGFVANPARTHG